MRRFVAYEASGDFEKVVGETLSQQLGVTDAPKEFFDEVRERVEGEVDEIDLEADETYETINRMVMETADEFGYIE